MPPEKCKLLTLTLEEQAGNDKEVKTPVLFDTPMVPENELPSPTLISTLPSPIKIATQEQGSCKVVIRREKFKAVSNLVWVCLKAMI